MSVALIFTRINTTTKEVKKETRKLPSGKTGSQFIEETVAMENGDGWRASDWTVTNLEDGSTKMQSGNIIYVFRTIKQKDTSKRAYHTDHVDRFLAHCLKILKPGPEDDSPFPASEDVLRVGEMRKVYDELMIPFSVDVTRDKETDEVSVQFDVAGVKVDLDEAMVLVVSLRQIIAIVRKIQKKKARLDI